MATITTIKERINQLDQASWLILCDAYLAREGYSNLVALGTRAGAQKTTPGTPDTYFCMSGEEYVFAEYTTQKEDLVSKMKKDIALCMNVSYTHIPLNVFKMLPLIPTSCSWSGSAVPMYSSWISHLKALMPIFIGIRFIKHKKRVEDIIQYLKSRIIEEEVSDIIEG